MEDSLTHIELQRLTRVQEQQGAALVKLQADVSTLLERSKAQAYVYEVLADKEIRSVMEKMEELESICACNADVVSLRDELKAHQAFVQTAIRKFLAATVTTVLTIAMYVFFQQ